MRTLKDLDDFVSYELAKKLHDKKYIIHSYWYYPERTKEITDVMDTYLVEPKVSAPTFSAVQKFLREELRLYFTFKYDELVDMWECGIKSVTAPTVLCKGVADTYQGSFEEAVTELLEDY